MTYQQQAECKTELHLKELGERRGMPEHIAKKWARKVWEGRQKANMDYKQKLDEHLEIKAQKYNQEYERRYG